MEFKAGLNVFLNPEEAASFCMQTDYCEAVMGDENGSIFRVVRVQPDSFQYDEDWVTVIPLGKPLSGRNNRERGPAVDRCCPDIDTSDWLMLTESTISENVRNIFLCPLLK